MKEKILRQKIRRKAVLCAVLMVLCVLCGVFAALVEPSQAAETGSRAVFTRRYESSLSSVADLTLRDPFTGRQFTVAAGLPFLFADSSTGVYAYCIQKGQEIFDTGSITRRAYSLYDPMFSGLPASAKENIALTALYGYPNQSAAQLGTDATTAHAATQLLLWESELGYRSSAFQCTDSRVVDAYCSGGHNADVRSVYEAIALQIQQHLRTPSFLEGGPLTLTLTYDPDSGLYTQHLTDTNGSNAALAIESGAGITIRRDGKDYIFSSAQPPERTLSLTLERTDIPPARKDLGPLLIWVDPACGADNQLLVSGVQPRSQCWCICIAPDETTTAPATTTSAATSAATTSIPTTDATTASTSASTVPDTTTTIFSTDITTTTANTSTFCTTTTAIISTECTKSSRTTNGTTVVTSTSVSTGTSTAASSASEPTIAATTTRRAPSSAQTTTSGSSVAPPRTGARTGTAATAVFVLCLAGCGAWLVHQRKKETLG